MTQKFQVHINGKQFEITAEEIAGLMNGHAYWFSDLIHFSEEGSARMACIVAGELEEA